ncbi:MAG: helix-turn-helix domain-containing protein [Spirochaetales bacterium]|nr:helix-turn-helix domain-containing protein [Spirochaetales bacterium]
MESTIDFTIATSQQIESHLARQIEEIRISRNITQQQLADEAGISLRTLGRLAKGEGVSLDTFLRIIIALNLQDNLKTMLPDPSIRPMERISNKGKERKRARPKEYFVMEKEWSWGDEKNGSK